MRRYLRHDGWQPYRSPARSNRLQGLEGWLAQRFVQHRGNADVVRQDLRREHGITISLRSVERAVAHLRREALAQTLATVRFETAPGQQMQIDFGSLRAALGGPVASRKMQIFPMGSKAHQNVRLIATRARRRAVLKIIQV